MNDSNLDTHQAAHVECPLCTKDWIACWPEDTKELECPNCNNIIKPIIK